VLSAVTPAGLGFAETKDAIFIHRHKINVRGAPGAASLPVLTILFAALSVTAALIQAFGWKLPF